MKPDAIANCARLRARFEDREAIYIEQGALRVRVTKIQANVAERTITADIEEIPTPGFPRFIGLNSVGLADSRLLKWTISAENLTVCSDHVWSHGAGGWSLFFDSELIREVLRFTATYSEALNVDAYERYRNILGWVQCHKSTQEVPTCVFPVDEGNRHERGRLDRPVPLLIAEGITFDDGGHAMRWGTPLHELAKINAPVIRWNRDCVFLSWQGHTWLDGLSCQMQTGRGFGAPDPRTYHHYIDEFHWALLLVNVEWGTTDTARERGFRELYAQLERILGPATFSVPLFDERLPSIHWEFRGMDIGYSLLKARPSIYVFHEPEGYSRLKADARELERWEGKGARVDYVAWPEPEREY
jgi:hypothetical protein